MRSSCFQMLHCASSWTEGEMKDGVLGVGPSLDLQSVLFPPSLRMIVHNANETVVLPWREQQFYFSRNLHDEMLPLALAVC